MKRKKSTSHFNTGKTYNSRPRKGGWNPGPLVKWRKINGFSTKEVAESIGVGERQYARYETGRNEPAIITLKKIIDLTGIKPMDLMREIPEEDEE
jgi:predicted transcriptional regulator